MTGVFPNCVVLYMDIDILRVVLLTSNIMHESVSLICCVLLFAVTSVALSSTYWGNPQCLCSPVLTHFVMHKPGHIDNQQCLKCGVCLLLYSAWGFIIYVFHSVTCVEYVLCFWIVICMHLPPLSSMFLLSKIKVVWWSLLRDLLNKLHWEICFMFTFKAASLSWLELMLGIAVSSFFLFIFLFHK